MAAWFIISFTNKRATKIDSTTAAIILAAGSSSRIGGGRHKLLLPLADRPVLTHVIETTLASSARPIIIVLGHQAELVRNAIAPYATQPNITIVENPNYRQGMSTSLHVGLHTLLQYSDSTPIDSALIMLGDQPLLTAQSIDLVLSSRRATGKRIIAPLYVGKRGNPVLFAADLFAELLKTSGDEGGRSVIERHRNEVATVEMGDVAASYDVDTWEAYQQVLQAWEERSESNE